MLHLETQAIWDEFSRDLRAFVARRVPATLVDDVVQDIFVKIHDHLDQLRDEERVAGWVYQVARSVVADALAASARELRAETRDAADPLEIDLRQSLGAWLTRVIDELPDPYANTLRQVELGAQTQAELARKLGMSHSAVKSRVQRGREMLRQRLARCCHVDLDATGKVMDYHCRRPGCCPS